MQPGFGGYAGGRPPRGGASRRLPARCRHTHRPHRPCPCHTQVSQAWALARPSRLSSSQHSPRRRSSNSQRSAHRHRLARHRSSSRQRLARQPRSSHRSGLGCSNSSRRLAALALAPRRSRLLLRRQRPALGLGRPRSRPISHPRALCLARRRSRCLHQQHPRQSPALRSGSSRLPPFRPSRAWRPPRPRQLVALASLPPRLQPQGAQALGSTSSSNSSSLPLALALGRRLQGLPAVAALGQQRSRPLSMLPGGQPLALLLGTRRLLPRQPALTLARRRASSRQGGLWYQPQAGLALVGLAPRGAAWGAAPRVLTWASKQRQHQQQERVQQRCAMHRGRGALPRTLRAAKGCGCSRWSPSPSGGHRGRRRPGL